mgnify:CR=1 FL=1
MQNNLFKLNSKFQPSGSQPEAIQKLVGGLQKGYGKQTLLGVTGSGKTFTMANVISQVQRPTLVISHNKTLAAQLASEFQDFFPENAVHYFVSYYDYYQPEAYIPSKDVHIEKETQINEEIDRLRHASTQAVLTRRDVIIVASVSCIYGLGDPEDYSKVRLSVVVGQEYSMEGILRRLHYLQYERNDVSLVRGSYSVKGEIIEIFAAHDIEHFYRLEFNGRKLEHIKRIKYLTRDVIDGAIPELDIFPAKHYLAPQQNLPQIISQIRHDVDERVKFFKSQDKLIEAQRIEERVHFDLEMIETIGYCNGIENYSRYMDQRKPGEPPATLIDYFPDDFLLVVDESHMTLPQIRGMYAGDQARKTTLVDYGWRLPAAMDNRPLQWDEFSAKVGDTIYMSATPADYELQHSKQIVEQVIRPTGLLDPSIEVRPSAGQIADVEKEILMRVKKGQRVLVTTLTKRLAEDLTEHLLLKDIKVQYLHSDVDTLDRITILKDLRQGKYDVLVGINLLREGLDLPEVSLVLILDADKEGFLRHHTSLIQTMGRAARHVDGTVIMYADRMTDSMKIAIEETTRRRALQLAYNKKYNITPRSTTRDIKDTELKGLDEKKDFAENIKHLKREEKAFLAETLTAQMKLAAENLNFEAAALLRDEIALLKKRKK